MRIISWNIDGIKAHFEALKELVAEYNPDIVCLQKFRCQSDPGPFVIPGYSLSVSAKVSAGVATYVKSDIQAETSERFHDFSFPGHLLATQLPQYHLTICNIYTPYANGNFRGADQDRMIFDHALYRTVEETPMSLIICGDMNVVHTELDTWDGKYVKDRPCYRDWERHAIKNLLDRGEMVDTFRHLHPTERKYSFFWHNDAQLRAENKGDRIDYALINNWMLPNLVQSDILLNVTDSPSSPLLLDIDLSEPIEFRPVKRYLIY